MLIKTFHGKVNLQLKFWYLKLSNSYLNVMVYYSSLKFYVYQLKIALLCHNYLMAVPKISHPAQLYKQGTKKEP